MPVIIIRSNRDDQWEVSCTGYPDFSTNVKVGDVRRIDPVDVLNEIHDFIQTFKGHPALNWVSIQWDKTLESLVENKGSVLIQSTRNMSIPYSFDEIEAFFDDKPGLYVKSEDSPSPCDITVTPWKPIQGDPILLRLPHVMADRAISQLVRMFLVKPVEEVRWQRGHVELKSYAVEDSVGAHEGYAAVCYNGNGYYVR